MNSSKEKSQPLEAIQDLAQEISREVNQLASNDFATVGKSLAKLVEKRIEADPYASIATAVGLGFALGELRLPELKLAAIRLSKLVALRGIGQLEENQQRFSSSASDAGKEEKKNAS